MHNVEIMINITGVMIANNDNITVMILFRSKLFDKIEITLWRHITVWSVLELKWSERRLRVRVN